MPLVAFDYRFSVRLPASADAAYQWATDYAPDDLGRMGEVGRRQIQRLAEGTILLTDTVRAGGRQVTKKRLVRLRPAARSWTNTHVAGPTRHSQFLYTIVPEGPHRSRLEFVGLQVERSSRRLTEGELSRRAHALAREDAAAWDRLARAMAEELGTASPPRRSARPRTAPAPRRSPRARSA